MNWDDLKFFLYVHRHGNLSAAAKALDVNQTTVGRRIQQFEEENGERLFIRTRNHWSLTQAGKDLLPRVEEVEGQALYIEHFLNNSGQRQETLKITAVETLLSHLLIPAVSEFRSRHPHLELTLLGGNQNMDLDRLEADIALRMARPTCGQMVISKLEDIGFALYCHQKMPRPDLKSAFWVIYDHSLQSLPEMSWIAENHPDAKIGLRCQSAAMVQQALKTGPYIGILPCFMGDTQPDLKRLSGPYPLLRREIWLACHEDLFNTPKIQAAIAWIKGVFAENKQRITG
ncbi:MAG: LysR family transcriptional regulator [Sneathiellales bacterium]|nr:LysR family transcriptional regulator [Sneathiellales bacterium]